MEQYTGRIPQDKIDEVRLAADIVQVVGNRTRLTQKGRDYWGLCPFHGDKDPSFKVDRERGTWYCFGCSEGGSVFNFVMRNEGLSFPEAVRYLAGRFGVELPKPDLSPAEAKAQRERKSLFEACRMAAEFYSSALAASPGAAARQYLTQKRSLSSAAIEEWGLGWARDEWEGLKRHLRSQGIGEEIALKAGLLAENQAKRSTYDRFRGRVIIPIKSRSGRVISFGGRIMGEGEPKYLNGAESPLFKKKSNLFNLDRARSHMRQKDRVLVVEGYFDVIACAVHGFEETVAPLGTALTAQQVRQLKGQASQVVLVFDGDQAGRKAATRSLPIFLQEQMVAKVLLLPQGEDPDSLLMERGAEEFEKLLQAARPLTEMVLDRIVDKGDQSTPEGRSATAQEAGGVIKQLTDPMVRWAYVERLARQLGQPPGVVADRLGIARPQGARAPVINSRTRPTAFDQDKSLLEFALCDPQAARALAEEGCLTCFEKPEHLAIGQAIADCLERGVEPTPDAVTQALEDQNLAGLVGELAICGPKLKPGQALKEVQSLLAALRRKRLLEERQARLRSVKLQENGGGNPGAISDGV
jgi:DNA primase